jgi:hypothetical protein
MSSTILPTNAHQSTSSLTAPSMKSCSTIDTESDISNTDPVPLYLFSFWLFHCRYTSHMWGEWKTHCWDHFGVNGTLKSPQCPLCPWPVPECRDWSAMMKFAYEMTDQNMKNSTRDRGLEVCLWQNDLVSEQDYKELQSGTFNSEEPQGNFVESTGRERRGQKRGVR